jgi:hypothetical protein
MVDDLLQINSVTELVCLTMRDAMADDLNWVTETLLESFHRD